MADENVNVNTDTNGVEGAVSVIDGEALLNEENEATSSSETEELGADNNEVTDDSNASEGEEGADAEDGDSKDNSEDAEDGDAVEWTPEAFEEAESGVQFKDANGSMYEKVEGCEIPVPMCDKEAGMYKELANLGFDQDVINREFWQNKGDLSEDTITALKQVLPAGMVDAHLAALEGEHVAYLDSLTRQNSDAVKAKEEAAAKLEKRDSETLDTAAKVFDNEDGKVAFDEAVAFINENYDLDRRKEIAATLQTGTLFSRKALLNAIKRDMDYNGGDVHKLINADGSVTAQKVVGGAITAEAYHDIISNPTNPDHTKYMNDMAFQNEIDNRRSKGINAGI